jgi:hypothetical protein
MKCKYKILTMCIQCEHRTPVYFQVNPRTEYYCKYSRMLSSIGTSIPEQIKYYNGLQPVTECKLYDEM